MTIPALPAAPSPTDTPAEFNTKAFAFLSTLDPWADAADALAVTMNADAASAALSETAAETAAGTATTKAGEASDSAIAAAASAVTAGNAATSAAASFDSFDDRYLGAKSSDPSLDNDGNALITGALYFNSTSNEMRVRTAGGTWAAAYIPVEGYLTTGDIGTTVQAYDADLTSWAAIAPSAKQDALVSGTSIKTVNSTSLLGSGDVAVQATLVSGSNIKTINSTSLLGSGDISISSAGGGGATASGSVTLTSASGGAQSVAFTDFGQYVKLPDATTMNKAAVVFSIANTSAYNGVVIDSAGSSIVYLPPYTSCTLGLADNSTAAGTWVIASSVGASPTGIEAALANTSIGATAMDMATTYNNNATGRSGPEIFALTGGNILIKGLAGCVIYDPAARTFGTPWVSSATSIHLAMLNGTSAVITYMASAVIKAMVLTFSGTTITAGAEATATAEVTGAKDYPFICATSATSGVILYYEGSTSTYGRMRGFTISGTTVSIGAASAQFGDIATGSKAKGIIATSSSSVLTWVSATNGGNFCAATLSGNTVTIGTAVAYSTSVRTGSSRTASQNFCALGNGKYFFPTVNITTNEVVVYLISISGTTITAPAATPGNLAEVDYQTKWIPFGTDSAVLQFVRASSNAQYIQIFRNTTGSTIAYSSAVSQNYSSTFYPDLPATPLDSGGRLCWFYESALTTAPTFRGLNLKKYTVSGTSFANYNDPLRMQLEPLNGYSDFGVPWTVLSNGSKRYMIGRAGTVVFDSGYTTSTFISGSKLPGLQALLVDSTVSNVGFFGNSWGIIVVGGAK